MSGESMRLPMTEKTAHMRPLGEVHHAILFSLRDESAFRRLFESYYAALTRFAWRFLGSRSTAEDVVQEVFMEVWQRRDSLGLDDSLRPMLYLMAKQRSLNHLKRQRVKGVHDGPWMRLYNEQAASDSLTEDADQRFLRDLAAAIEDLPSRCAMTYRLHRHDGLTYDEIAQVMQVSPKTVEAQMTRALSWLRQRLAAYHPMAGSNERGGLGR